MASGVKLDWKGDDIAAKVREAQIGGVNEVAAACVQEAAKRPPHPFKTGLAQGSLRAEPARAEGKRVFTIWGSFDVDYYIWLELRGNMLRNAADENYPKLAAAIKKRLA